MKALCQIEIFSLHFPNFLPIRGAPFPLESRRSPFPFPPPAAPYASLACSCHRARAEHPRRNSLELAKVHLCVTSIVFSFFPTPLPRLRSSLARCAFRARCLGARATGDTRGSSGAIGRVKHSFSSFKTAREKGGGGVLLLAFFAIFYLQRSLSLGLVVLQPLLFPSRASLFSLSPPSGVEPAARRRMARRSPFF